MSIYVTGDIGVLAVLSRKVESGDILEEQDIAKNIFSYGFSAGVRIHDFGITYRYAKDFNEIIQTVNHENQKSAVLVSYYF